jgi:hypothetical protein
LPISDLHNLIEWLQERIEEIEVQAAQRAGAKRQAVRGSARNSGEWTYRQEFVRCGTANCKCTRGQGHGPYWYRYRAGGERGKTISEYVGKMPPWETNKAGSPSGAGAVRGKAQVRREDRD